MLDWVYVMLRRVNSSMRRTRAAWEEGRDLGPAQASVQLSLTLHALIHKQLASQPLPPTCAHLTAPSPNCMVNEHGHH
jgi:hypothetical protein